MPPVLSLATIGSVALRPRLSWPAPSLISVAEPVSALFAATPPKVTVGSFLTIALPAGPRLVVPLI